MTTQALKMSKKQSKEELEKKRDYHLKRVEFYKKKIEEAEKKARRIGFKWYD